MGHFYFSEFINFHNNAFKWSVFVFNLGSFLSSRPGSTKSTNSKKGYAWKVKHCHMWHLVLEQLDYKVLQRKSQKVRFIYFKNAIFAGHKHNKGGSFLHKINKTSTLVILYWNLKTAPQNLVDFMKRHCSWEALMGSVNAPFCAFLFPGNTAET